MYSCLRMRFVWENEVLQIIDKTQPLDWRYMDCCLIILYSLLLEYDRTLITPSASRRAGLMAELPPRYISKMYFSLWNTPEVSERMWSVNLDASILEEYQTVGGHSGRPSE